VIMLAHKLDSIDACLIMTLRRKCNLTLFLVA